MSLGLEALNVYSGIAYMDVEKICEIRGYGMDRFSNLMMKKKTVPLLCEDPVTNAVNAAKPIIDQLTQEEKDKIELLICSSESGIDFGKSISNYVHEYLGLSKNCIMFEIKQACFGGTAAYQMALSYVSLHKARDIKALVIATDIPRIADRMNYAEPSQGSGAAALLVSNHAMIFEQDLGAYGCYAYEIMDTCRPSTNMETGNPDLSLMSYLDCFENSYQMYQKSVNNVDFLLTFDYFAFHTPFGGMVKGAHRKMMRSLYRAKGAEIEEDFQARIAPSLQYCMDVGNVYSSSVYYALASLIDHIPLNEDKRVGIYSYGSGCYSLFFSGVISGNAKEKMKSMNIEEKLARRCDLSVEQYETILDMNAKPLFGIKDIEIDLSSISDIYNRYVSGKGYLVLKSIHEYHREYIWS